MRVLVTGGAGFIGSHIVDSLITEQFDVAIVDNLSTGKTVNINPNAKMYQCDITCAGELDEVFSIERPDVVIHHAAQISVQHSLRSPFQDAYANILGTINVLQSCTRHSSRKIVYASSAAVYGNPSYLPIDEQHPIEPFSPYGISKHTPEHYIMMFGKTYGLDYTIFRYANVYGPRQDGNGEGGVISIFIKKMLKGKPVIVFGDGLQTRDFIYVEDIAHANLLAIERGSKEIINVGTNIQTSVLNLYYEIYKFNTKSPSPEVMFQPEKPGDIKHSYLAITKAESVLGWRPRYTLLQGLAKTISHYR